MQTPAHHQRLGVLDGYRGLAILLVLGFHYCSRWTPPRASENLYPYGDLLRDIPVVGHGYLGVELFFIISGFVIALTLISSRDWLDFALRRAARLVPSMFLCSIVTYAILALLPVKHFETALIDFVPSFSFIEPYVWEKILGTPVHAIDGAYWSLFVEVKFYFWACLLFFVFKEHRFLTVFAIFFNVVLALEAFGVLVSNRFIISASTALFAAPYLPWFGGGVAFFYLFHDRKNTLAGLLAIETLVMVGVRAITADVASEIPFDLAFYALFFLFVFHRKRVHVFDWKPLALIGEASYSLYLLHQNVGVTLIALMGSLVGANSYQWSAFVVPLVMIVMILFSLFIYRHWEVPAKRKLLELGRPLLDRLRNASWRSSSLSTTVIQDAHWRRHPAPPHRIRGKQVE
jgi:peptidoglycan/LPS O-acetylase OafA/YrhL